jgi:hypothetical protein
MTPAFFPLAAINITINILTKYARADQIRLASNIEEIILFGPTKKKIEVIMKKVPSV